MFVVFNLARTTTHDKFSTPLVVGPARAPWRRAQTHSGSASLGALCCRCFCFCFYCAAAAPTTCGRTEIGSRVTLSKSFNLHFHY